MGPINWLAVLGAMLLGALAWLLRQRVARLPNMIAALLLFALPALMLGHALARIGVETLALKPKLYWMQSGGMAVFFVIPALVLTQLRSGQALRQAMGPILRDAAFWLAVYLTMGTLFWALA